MTEKKRKKLKKQAVKLQREVHNLIANYQSNSPKSKALQLRVFYIHLRLYNRRLWNLVKNDKYGHIKNSSVYLDR